MLRIYLKTKDVRLPRMTRWCLHKGFGVKFWDRLGNGILDKGYRGRVSWGYKIRDVFGN